MSMMEVRTSVRMPRDLHAAIEQAAAKNGLTFNEYIRRVLAQELKVELPPDGRFKRG